MSDEDSISTRTAAAAPVKSAGGFTSTILPAIGAFIAVRLFGIVGLIVACAVFFVLRERIGAIFAAILAFVAAGAVWLSMIYFLVQTTS